MSVTIAFVKETAAGERRAALSPETCKKLLALKTKILIERGAGLTAHFTDDSYIGAEISDNRDEILASADKIRCGCHGPVGTTCRPCSGAKFYR